MSEQESCSCKHITPECLDNPKKFSFMDYDVIAFDLDNTLCRYNLPELLKLEYNCMSNFIINKGTFPKEFLMLPYEEGQDFVLKGLFLDLLRGNVVRIAPDGTIVQASHGTKQLSCAEINSEYGGGHWDMTDRFINDPFSIWLGKPALEIQAMSDYFDISATLVFGRLVDNIDKSMGVRPPRYDIFPDILACLHDMYDYEQFKYNKGSYYPTVKAEPGRYIIPSGERVVQWLEELKNAGKILVLITGSHVDYSTFISEYSVGPKWNKIFDVKIFKARKPGFWHLDRSFKHAESEEDVPVSQLEIGQGYLEGSYKVLKLFLSKITQKSDPKMVYIGDSMLQDVYAPSFYCDMDTVAIVEEVESEGEFGYKKLNTDGAKSILSETWGSFFRHNKIDSSDSVWTKLLKRHAKLIAPSISSLAEKPINHVFTTCFRNES